ncbi:MAG: amidohydrolase family protein [Phycisphaerales bacterium]|nr:amidohydrolase family protein [Phycisphaerales bacterium]
MNQSGDLKPPHANPANRIGLDYRQHGIARLGFPRIDVHSHVNDVSHTRALLDAADCFEIGAIVSMTALAKLPDIAAAHPDRFRFIAVPQWRKFEVTSEFRALWCDDLRAFSANGSRWCKFWVAPPMRGDRGLTLQSEFLRPVIETALALNFQFMVHVGDPSVWFAPGARYSDAAKYGSKIDQYPQLDWFAEFVAPRTVIAAHMGGSAEDPTFLDRLLSRHANLMLDTSATKWIVREVSRHPLAIRELVTKWPDRVLFGSDIVTDEQHDFEHYASRYWAQETLWQTDYRGESPIDDPDAANPPRLHGVALPPDVLKKVFRENALRIKIAS